MEMTNDERAGRARVACESWCWASGGGDGVKNSITDLLADLLHLCDAEGLCPESVLGTARMHYDAEYKEEN